MRFNKGLHEEDFDDDKDDPCLNLQLISLQVQYNNDLPYVRKYLLFHRVRYEPFINTPFWNTLPLPTQNFIYKAYTEKKDIQFTPYERLTSDYPVTPISPSTDLFIDDSFENPLPTDLSSHDVDHLDNSFENMGFSDNFLGNIISPAINWNNYLDPNVDEDKLIEDDLKIDEFMDKMYAACDLSPVSSTVSHPSSPVLATYDNMSLIFLSDLDNEFSDSDDESSFLPFDNETLTYYKTEWIELFCRSVCFSFIPFYIRPPSFALNLTEISSKQFPAPLSPLFFLDLRVTHVHRSF
ncbi:uncharacterized protein OCT59_021842 [Rhizophagus irregularis]|uniref:Uncharacterized protein n=2 Tax=Rhizophagus irregularis TaxID=588596 RepID=U9SXN5_RHIID|nr:hypothetical protein GLOIN_2v1814676 [Rhizophagus irregularis DAOM 181602=DAOM 197198]EXX61741.1 hypothetical protein RirG_168390 [Rhizophagus irregularis DAOM 197198w]UZO28310.1 hypothetical protein OCT59_021842 [Rhizophagus irregularis]POG61044.1 hypothetical protein GLOIN_2v1814676 [Rhizophagus irregularis DAOM 181602=DAOM 197198]CAG8769296.1 12852_t:CDS:1 [Rhizophagus irregularis]GBC35810.1 hypothetical protein GLOIN_2v1814676 [Rhizophagus irregularis DAOM 181602=DAOM 197198]|eukprot:XP_025167910.1 hypothetical protein GLOIN_2v1814676 [Rhizophagus irregularis DAOM 181602=DAOM 197198]